MSRKLKSISGPVRFTLALVHMFTQGLTRAYATISR